LKAGKIKAIRIRCHVESGIKHFEAVVTTSDGKPYVLPIADADAFVANFDAAVAEYISQGAPIAINEKFDIEYNILT
jgi:hypothetical protein